MARQLADALGHLPLALAIAAAYMSHCDVTCAEYYHSLSSSAGSMASAMERQQLSDYPMGVRDSLQLSLERMRSEEREAGATGLAVLDCVSFLAPDGITRQLVTLIVHSLHDEPKTDGPEAPAPAPVATPPVSAPPAVVHLHLVGIALASAVAFRGAYRGDGIFGVSPRKRRWAMVAAAITM